MRLTWLTANAAWTVVFGDSIVPIGEDSKRFFATRDEAIAELAKVRLGVRGLEVVALEELRPCYHPLSCATCNRLGEACRKHTVGEPGHDRCSGSAS